MPISDKITSECISDELIVVRVYYFDIFKSLINNGFIYNNEKYVFFTASAGQIRTKKNVFIKESALKKHHDKLFCGLSLDKINALGGVHRNKYLAYLALCNSATEMWEDFDIDRCIVVDDVETEVRGLVDYIHTETWEIERKEMLVPINHTDGCGMILPCLSKKNFMFRMPWFKGLLVSFPFDKWVLERGASPKIKDIYGNEYDIFEDKIQVIFTKSQFKLWKFYKSWDEYKYYFKLYGCEAGICNVEEDYIENGCLSYQMLQTLPDLTDDELRHISKKTNYLIESISTNRDTMLRSFGVKKSNKNMNYFQKSLQKYPELLSDAYTRNMLAEKKKKIVKEAWAGRLKVEGKYTFISPDWYAMCERIFEEKDDMEGLLKDGEVYCSLYKNKAKLDCLRSPHLYAEHVVRKNMCLEKLECSKWFTTKALYTSCHDLMSKILMFDNDGDTSLVVADEVIIKVAERNCRNVVPLYYEMRKGKDSIIDNNELYEGMIAAYTGGNIGEISNNITKVWNSEEIDIDVIKCLCRINNEIIDYAKTLYKSPLPDWLKHRINKYTSKKLPYFFIYAKDKTKKQVQPRNNRPVNRLQDIVQNKRFNFNEKLFGKFNYKNLMKNQMIIYSENNKLHKAIVDTYKEQLKQHKDLFSDIDGESGNFKLVYAKIRNFMVSEFGDIDFIVDVLVSYLFGVVDSKKKNILWGSFGDILYRNISMNIDSDTFSCSNCGKRVKKINDSRRNAQKYCSDCSSDIQYYKPVQKKKITCIDCGIEFEVDSKANRRIRCDKCQTEANKMRYIKYNKKRK